MRVVLAAALAVAAGVGYFGHDVFGSKDTRLQFPDLRYSPSSMNLGCTAVTEGSVFENRLDGPTANAHAAPGTEKLALTLSDDRKTLSLLYANDVGVGATEPIPLEVHSITSSSIMAAGRQLGGETAVILDLKTWKAVVSFTGQGMFGIKGSSFLVQCH
jgi:hypothetical protein